MQLHCDVCVCNYHRDGGGGQPVNNSNKRAPPRSTSTTALRRCVVGALWWRRSSCRWKPRRPDVHVVFCETAALSVQKSFGPCAVCSCHDVSVLCCTAYCTLCYTRNLVIFLTRCDGCFCCEFSDVKLVKSLDVPIENYVPVSITISARNVCIVCWCCTVKSLLAVCFVRQRVNRTLFMILRFVCLCRIVFFFSLRTLQ